MNVNQEERPMKIINNIDFDNKSNFQETIVKNNLNRNKHLTNLINIVNNVDGSIVIGIDGKWGTGKTVFLKQFEYLLNDEDDEAADNLFTGLSLLKEKTEAFYFNSWENDIYENPLLALLLNLLNIKEEKLGVEKYNKEAFFKVIEVVANVAAKMTTAGALGVDDVKIDKSEISQLLESVTTVDKIKDEIHNFLNVLTEKKELIIIIDELDRCKPTFAVELLEVVKHYFKHKKIKFIICSNKSELSHTIRNYYGQGFNGYEYLDRFVDFEYLLPAPKAEKYFLEVLGYYDIAHKNISKEVIKHLDLSLRQVNKYTIYSDMLLNSSNNYRFGHNFSNESLIIAFYLIGLKIKDNEQYDTVLKGRGVEIITDFFNDGIGTFNFMIRDNQNNRMNDNEAVNTLVDEYKKSFEFNNKLEDIFEQFSYIQ